MNRRSILLALAAIGVSTDSLNANGQAQTARRIGVLSALKSAQADFVRQSLRDALSKFGYKEGGNLLIEWRFAELRPEALSGLAEDLVRHRVDLIVAISNEPAAAAKRVTSSISIVMHGVGLPVELGLIQSLARPGANLTGTTFNSPEVAGKVLELLRATVPGLQRVGIVWNPTFPGMRIYEEQTVLAAKEFKVTLEYFEVTESREITAALDRLAASRVDALYVVGDPVVNSVQSKVAAFALDTKLVSIGVAPTYISAGGLLYYGPDVLAITQRTAYYVDRILRGSEPRDLPVEQPTKYLLVVNMRTAKAIGVTVPRSILARADQIVE